MELFSKELLTPLVLATLLAFGGFGFRLISQIIRDINDIKLIVHTHKNQLSALSNTLQVQDQQINTLVTTENERRGYQRALHEKDNHRHDP